jgi:hypothetical protein
MNKVFFGLGLMLVLNLAAAAQTQKMSPDSTDAERNQTKKQSRATSADKKSKTAKKTESLSTLSTVANLQAQLESTLDVKNARVGDEVILKTTQAVRQNGETIIPKGANLVGRVTEATQRSKNGVASRLGLVFDRLEGKDLSAPITASILSITDVRAATQTTDLFDSELNGSTRTTGSAGRGNSAGGLLGGVGNAVGGVVNTATNTVGGVAGTATQAVGTSVGSVGNTVNGLRISNSASGSAAGSATLTSDSKNVRLEKGLMFQMQVANQAGNPE